MFIFENKSFSRSKPVKSIYIQKIFNAYQKNLRLFLLTIIPITCIGIVIRLVIIVLTPKYLVIVDMLPLIEKAGESLLQGNNPYQVYYFPYAMPLTFPERVEVSKYSAARISFHCQTCPAK